MSCSRRLIATGVVLALIASLAGAVTYSAFTATATNAGNTFSSGTVALGDNDGGSALLTLTNAVPGNSDIGCIQVTYSGSLPASVRLFGAVTGSLAQYLTLTVTRGTDSSPSFKSCTNFTADSTVYVVGQPAGVVWTGNLSAFPTTWTAGIVDPTATLPESWTTNEAHSYKFEVSLQNNTAAQGLSSTAAFTWEARSS